MKTELLAPAGSWEALTAAFTAGADAVYLGGAAFGARAYAKNFTEEELLRAIDYAHLHGKKLYLTVNTLFKEEELEEQLFPYLLPYYRQGLDAVIVQDLGVMRAIRRWFPDLPIHASTQMTVTGAAAARLIEQQGAVRVVPARELSLTEIKKIHRTTHLEIECFVHGALCYCYSGQCLMSSLIGGRSGNRGRCAQPCRLPYEVYEKGKRLGERSDEYPLSPKDMCTVEILPEILRAGVNSLKIEGRMKKPEYTAGVVSIYRKYLDLYEKDPSAYRVLPEDLKKLYDIYNRDGFHQSYFKVRNGRDMMALKNEKQQPGSQRVRRNEQLFYEIQRDYLDTVLKEPVSGYLTLFKDIPAALTVYAGERCVTVEKEGVQKSLKQPLTEARVRAQLEKTGNTPFFFEHLDIMMEEDVFVPMQFLSELRREALELLEKELTADYRRSEPKKRALGEPEMTGTAGAQSSGMSAETVQMPETKGTAGAQSSGMSAETVQMPETKGTAGAQDSGMPAETVQMPGMTGTAGAQDSGMSAELAQMQKKKGRLPVRALAENWNQISVLQEFEEIDGIYADLSCFSLETQEKAFSLLASQKERNKELYLALPHAVRDGQLTPWRDFFRELAEEGLAGFLVRNLESYAFLKEAGLGGLAAADYSLYTMNHEAQAFWKKEGILRDTVPYELNRQELSKRDNSGSEMVVYGYLPMMVSVQCVKKTMDGCNKKNALVSLKDRYRKQFPVRCYCDSCYNVVYNSLPLGLLGEAEEVRALRPASVRLSFSIEGKEETRVIAEHFLRAYCCGEAAEADREYTKGHFRRKAE